MNLVGVWRGSYVTAKSARNYIDAENIIKDAYKLKKYLEEIDSLTASITRVGSELTKDVLYVDGKDMSGNVDYTIQFINDTKNAQISYLDEIIQRAVSMYNETQEELNKQAQYEDRKQREKNQNGG